MEITKNKITLRELPLLLISFIKYNKIYGLSAFLDYFKYKRWIKNNKNFKKNRTNKIEKIIFFIGTNKGTYSMNCLQPCQALRKRGINAFISVKKLPKNLDNSLIILVKYFPYKEIIKVMSQKCILIYNILDEHKPFSLENESILCDGFIYPNKRKYKDTRDRLPIDLKHFVMYHHWDPRFNEKENTKDKEKLSIAYFGGDPTGVLYGSKIKELKLISSFPDQLKYKDKYNCLYSIRKSGSYESLYKPSTKVATAAAINANIITSRDSSAIELLGENYPYLTNTNFKSVQNTIDYAKRTFGKKVWRDALKIMKKVKKQTDINNVINGYIEMMDELSNVK